MLTVGNLLGHYAVTPFGTNKNQVRYVTLIDSCSGEVIFNRLRIEGALIMLNKELEIEEWAVKVGTPHRTQHHGPIKESIIFEIVAPVTSSVEHYYSDEEWEILKSGKELE